MSRVPEKTDASATSLWRRCGLPFLSVTKKLLGKRVGHLEHLCPCSYTQHRAGACLLPRVGAGIPTGCHTITIRQSSVATGGTDGNAAFRAAPSPKSPVTPRLPKRDSCLISFSLQLFHLYFIPKFFIGCVGYNIMAVSGCAAQLSNYIYMVCCISVP